MHCMRKNYSKFQAAKVDIDSIQHLNNLRIFNMMLQTNSIRMKKKLPDKIG